jgi:hypothetical protein
MDIQERPIRALSEIVPGADHLLAVREFNENTLSLELLKNYENILFFRIASGYAGLTQFPVLFDGSAASDRRLHQYTGLTLDLLRVQNDPRHKRTPQEERSFPC